MELNAHNKQEYPPMHTAEHILNQTMVRMFGCPRSKNTHIERKKSKCDYLPNECPSDEQVAAIGAQVNAIIAAALPVTISYVSKEEAADIVDLSKLPEDVSDTLRIVRVGEYDACACIGAHVENSKEIGQFRIISHSFDNGVWRVRFKLNEPSC
jgi:Ser-tRNA(Ala) deacylase AlaX